jgi:hypothetical protein
VTPEERRLLEATARSVLKIREDILDRMTGVEMVLHAIFLAKGNTDIALARLRVLADLLARKGTPSRKLFTSTEPGVGSRINPANPTTTVRIRAYRERPCHLTRHPAAARILQRKTQVPFGARDAETQTNIGSAYGDH